jgi:hypothetical protein
LIAYTVLFAVGYVLRRFDMFSGLAASMILSVVLVSPFPYLLFRESRCEKTSRRMLGYRLLETLVTALPLVGGMIYQGFCILPDYVNMMVFVAFALSITPLVLCNKAVTKQIDVLQYCKMHWYTIVSGVLFYLILWYLCVCSVI